MDTSSIVEKLQVIEEELRDLAYSRLMVAATASFDSAADATKDEKRVLQARRAVEKAIRALDAVGQELD